MSLIHHLQRCPANVVSCSHSWDTGSPIYRFLKCTKSSQLSRQQQQKQHEQQQQKQQQQQGDDDGSYYWHNGAEIAKSTLTTDLGGDFSRRTVDVQFSFDNQDGSNPLNQRWANKCGELLRRDQYRWHVKNVHDDIPDQFRSIVQMCPYQQYGCPFVQFAVKPKFVDLRFSQHFNCFATGGETMTTTRRVEELSLSPPTPGSDLSLTDLDYDIFSLIFYYLDSLSLARLAQTCHYLRAVCAETLETEGIVFPVWTKVDTGDGSVSWKISKLVRKFAVSFAPIRDWVRTDVPCIGNHSRVCVYNERNKKVEKFPLVGMTTAQSEH